MGQDRFRYYWSLRDALRSPWIQINHSKISPKEAMEQGRLPPDIIDNGVFRAWLGIDTHEFPRELLTFESEKLDTKKILFGLAEWWEKHGAEQLKRYNSKVYPDGQIPNLRLFDGNMTTSERREWMILLILGSFHTMGRQKPEQHREFLVRCSKKGWLDFISAQGEDSRKWIDFIEFFIDDRLGNQDYYHWMRQFISFYQLNHWLPVYIDIFMNIDRFDHPLTVDDIVDPRRNPDFSGGGPDAPPLRRSLGRIGIHFVLRELVRLEAIRGKNIIQLCYVPAQRIRNLLSKITNGELFESSNDIYQLLVKHLGTNNATFGKAFDLPLIALADNEDLQQEIMGQTIEIEIDDEWGS